MIKFGTGGWRAIIGEDFTKKNIQLLAKAIAKKMKYEKVENKGIVIGYDRRFLAKEAMQWAAIVFAEEGIKAKLVNKSVPTPVIMYYVMKYEMPYGMMITASHNPAIYNGIKIFTEGGRDADEIQTTEIEEYIEKISKDDIVTMQYQDYIQKKLIEEIYPLNEYIDNIIEAIDMKAIRGKNLKIALDPMYGVSETSLTTIFHTARCDVITIHERHDTLFGGKLPSPSAKTLRTLQTTVTENNCDIGIATDGDADRLGVIDDTGRFLHPNDILVLLYYYLVKYKNWKGPVVRNIATTHMLDNEAKIFGEVCYEVPVGFKHISAKMYSTNAVIGGESSGGLTVRGHIKGKDGIYAASLLVEMIAVTGKKLSKLYQEITDEIGKKFMEERDYVFSNEKKNEVMKKLMIDKKLPEMPFNIDHVSYLDGSKVYFENGGWLVSRFSGTEPLIRIFAEMPSKNESIKIIEIYEKFLKLK